MQSLTPQTTAQTLYLHNAPSLHVSVPLERRYRGS